MSRPYNFANVPLAKFGKGMSGTMIQSNGVPQNVDPTTVDPAMMSMLSNLGMQTSTYPVSVNDLISSGQATVTSSNFDTSGNSVFNVLTNTGSNTQFLILLGVAAGMLFLFSSSSPR